MKNGRVNTVELVLPEEVLRKDTATELQDMATRQVTIAIAGASEDNRRFLMDVMQGQSCRLIQARSDPEVLDLLQSESVDLLILSSQSPEINALQCCRTIKADRKTELIPVLMLMAAQNMQAQIEALSAGADEFLVQPMYPELTRSRIRALLRHKAATDRLEQAETILFALSQAVEQRDRTTGDHCERLGLLSVALGLALGLPREDLQALYRGGYLHDIGKVGMPDSILLKPGPLDAEEWDTMRTHTIRGEEICRPMKSLQRVLPIIRSHHERWDGSGYPDSLKRDQIPLLARVLQMADIYDALTSVRPYKTALTPDTAVQIMQEETERGWRDPQLMSVFTRLHEQTLRTACWRDVPGMQSSLRNLHVSLLGTR
jgi:putative two-component system response regulator